MSRPKPAEYNLQVSLDSLHNDRVLNLESTAPFASIAVGDKFYPSSENSHWFSERPTPSVLYVVDVAHAVSETEALILNHIFIALSSVPPVAK